MKFLYDRVMFLLYYLCVLTMKSLLVILTRWRVYGQQNFPKEGPVLVVSNHLNLADPPLLAASLPRKLTFMAKRELFQSWVLRPIVQAFSFPVSRGTPNKESLKQANITLRKGKPLAMFPEGKRSFEAQLLKGFPGSSLIALKAGVPLLPIGITGSQSITSIKSVLRHPHITVNIGEIFHLPEVNGVPTRNQLNEATELVMRKIAALLPEEYQGEYRLNSEWTELS